MALGAVRSLIAAGVSALLVCLSFTAPLTANRTIRFAIRWSRVATDSTSRFWLSSTNLNLYE